MFNLTTSGFALEWFRSQFCKEMDEKEFYESYLEKILSEKRKCPVKFHPHLAGDRTSFIQKKASFTGLTLSTERDDCLYAVMEAISGRTEKTLNEMAKRIELDKVIHLTGGGANEVLLSYKRSRFPGFDIVVKEDCALHGCAYMARLKLGEQ